MLNRHQIEIVTTFVDNVSGATKRVQKSIQDMGNGVERTTTTMDGMSASGKRLNTTTTQVTRGIHRFRMEFLSVMFFGMALNRMFNGLIKTSLEWVGITELMTETLGIFFLPVAEQLLDILLPIMMWFIDLDPRIQKIIGWFVVFGTVISGALFMFGQMALGLMGLQALGFGTTIANLLGIGTAAGTATGKVALLKSILGKVALVAIGITIAWAGFEFLRAGIKEGSILKELGGIIGMGLGGGAIGLAIGGPWGAGIGFAMGITGAIVIDWAMGGDIGKAAMEVAKKGAPWSLQTKLAGWGIFDIADRIREIVVSDAIISPSGQVITTNPNDYLIATKNPGSLGTGITFIVQGDLIGLDSEDISKRLSQELSNKISL